MKAGVYEGKITNHGTDIAASGLPFVFIDVEIPDPDAPEFPAQGRCKLFLGGHDEGKTATAIRMARAGLKLCGFDPDTEDLTVLDEDPMHLCGNTVKVSVSQKESNGKIYENYNILIARSTMPPERAAELTTALRAAKSKDEAPPAAPARAPGMTRGGDPNPPKLQPSRGGGGSGYVKKGEESKAPPENKNNWDDIPF